MLCILISMSLKMNIKIYAQLEDLTCLVNKKYFKEETLAMICIYRVIIAHALICTR